MSNPPTTVQEYLAALPDDRRRALKAIRAVIRKNLDQGYEEGIQYGMIGYYVPHRVYPDGYHCDPKQPLPFAALASQKNHMAIYLMGIYGSEEHERWFREAWTKTGKRLDMGKACVRFRKLEDVPLDVVGEVVKRIPAKAYIESYEANVKTARRSSSKKKAATKKAAKGTAKKKASKKVAAKKKKTAGATATKKTKTKKVRRSR